MFLYPKFVTDFEILRPVKTDENVAGTQKPKKFIQDLIRDLPTIKNGPYFDKSVSTNVTGLVGKTAYLRCRVKNIGNRTERASGRIHLFRVSPYCNNI
ncbi:hypothetical protein PGB90_006561 [Kerria lacca]